MFFQDLSNVCCVGVEGDVECWSRFCSVWFVTVKQLFLCVLCSLFESIVNSVSVVPSSQ